VGREWRHGTVVVHDKLWPSFETPLSISLTQFVSYIAANTFFGNMLILYATLKSLCSRFTVVVFLSEWDLWSIKRTIFVGASSNG
jgi:hypothetical protein